MPPKKKDPHFIATEFGKTVYLQQRWATCQKIGKAIYHSDLTFEFLLSLEKTMSDEKGFEKIINLIYPKI